MSGMDEIIEKYIKLRDGKAQLVQKHKEKMQGIDSVLTRIEAALLEEFREMGVQSVKTDAGTAYVQLRTSAGVADWDAVLAYIKENDAWDMLERRVNKSAVESFREEKNDLPPGVNWREEQVVNVRRS